MRRISENVGVGIGGIGIKEQDQKDTIAAMEMLTKLLTNPEYGLITWKMAVQEARKELIDILDAVPRESQR